MIRPERAALETESAVLVDDPRDLAHGHDNDFAVVATFDNRLEVVVEVVLRAPLYSRGKRETRVTGLFCDVYS